MAPILRGDGQPFSMGVRCDESTLGYPLNITGGFGNTGTHRVVLPQLTASSCSRMRPPGELQFLAIAVARALLGDAPDFDVEPLAYVGVQASPLFVVLGIVAGLAAALYNSLLLGTLAAMDRLSHGLEPEITQFRASKILAKHAFAYEDQSWLVIQDHHF